MVNVARIESATERAVIARSRGVAAHGRVGATDGLFEIADMLAT